MSLRGDISVLLVIIAGVLSAIFSCIGISLWSLYASYGYHEVVRHPFLIYGAATLALPIFCLAVLRRRWSVWGMFALWMLCIWFAFVVFAGPQGSRGLHENIRNMAIYFCIPLLTQVARILRPSPENDLQNQGIS